MRSSRVLLGLALTLALVVSGFVLPAATRAEEDLPTGVTVVRPAAPNDARVRFVHAVPGPANSPSLPVDIYRGDTRIAASVPFTTISDYIEFTPGDLTFRVFLAGSLPSGTPVAQAVLSSVSNGVYTCVVHPGTPPQVVITCTADSLTIAAGQARLKFYHFSQAVQTLSPGGVDVRNSGTGAVLLDNLTFGNTGFIDVPAGSYNLVLTNSEGAPLLPFNNVQVTAGLMYSLFAMGDPTQIGVPNAITNTNAKVRVVHAAVGVPNVDVFVDGIPTPVLRDVPFFEASEYLEVPAGTYTFRVFQTGQGPSGAALLTAGPVTVEAGKAYTAVARGNAADLTSLGVNLYFDDLSAATPGRTRVRAFHLSPGAPSVSLALNGQAVPSTTLSFGQASSYLEIPAGTNTIQAIVASGPSQGAVALTLPQLTTSGSQIADVFVVDLPANLRGEVRFTSTATAARVVHAAPTVGAVDVYLGEGTTPALRNVPFRTIGGYLFTNPALTRVRVFPTGANPATATAAIDTYLSLEAGKQYTIAARNQGSAVRAVVFRDSTSTAPRGQARVNVYHLSPTVQALAAGGVDVDVINGPKLVNDLQLDQVQSAEVPINSYTVRITNSTGSQVLVPSLAVSATGRLVYDLFAIDEAAGPTVISTEGFPLDVPTYRQSLPVIGS